jgi:alkanesulfonate monooxygenase SsuD/methylene tetrahydromethanopterin reductase-like flavin-dependent oxidoreductase (luciferase family)
MLAHVPADFHLAARSADVVFITPKSAEDARAIVAEVRTHEVAIGRAGPRLRVYADMVVFVDEDGEAARSRKEALDELDSRPLRSDAHLFAGSVAELADLLEEWGTSGIDGFRLRPGTLPGDLEAISRQLVPVLQQRGRFRDHYEEHTLRGRLGLRRPENRYAHA